MRKSRVSMIVMVFTLCIFALQISLYPHDNLSVRRVTKQETGSIESIFRNLELNEEFQCKPCDTSVLSLLRTQVRPATGRVVFLYAFFVFSAPVVFVARWRERDWFLCRFQAYLQSMLKILYDFDGKRKALFGTWE